jgi:multidrug efflux pump subunit AcrA (membrane-fusion protein)
LKKHTQNRLFITLFPILVGIAIVAWWNLQNTGNSNTTLSLTAKVIRRDFSASVLATGVVKPQVGAEVRVGARISGKVEHLHLNVGDRVEKGQLIAEIEKTDLEANVSQKEAGLKVAEATLAAIGNQGPKDIEKAKAAVGVSKAARWPLLSAEIGYGYKDKMLPPEQEDVLAGLKVSLPLFSGKNSYDIKKAESDLELAETRYSDDLKIAEAKREQTKAEIAFVKAQLSYATIRAPIPGVIASVSTQEGETVAAGFNAPTFVTIIDLRRLQVDAYVDEVDIGKIKTGQETVFTVDAFPAREFKGKVVAIYPKAVIQGNVVNYDVVIEIAGSYDGLLRPEMTASVTIFLEKREQVLAVPAKAVKRERGKNIIYIPSETGPESREIKVGWKDGQRIEVAAGLE